jgi:hypothetical protein
MQSAGLLDEQTELHMTSQIEGLRTNSAAQMAMLSEGRENLLPGLVAGRRRSAGAFDSSQLAALSFRNAGLPFRGQGAMGGGQLAVQNAYADMIFNGGDVGPRSRTSDINNAGMGGEVPEILKAILRTLQSSASTQGQRPNAGIGQAAGTLTSRDPSQGNNGVDRGSF